VLELFPFDEAYVGRLREGDPSTESHFVEYFSQLIQIKLRARFLAAEVVDDLRQETFARVIRSLRSEGGIRQANRLGPFVNSVCNNVLLEYYRSGLKNVPLDTNHLELPDKVLNLESLAISQETQQAVRNLLLQLPDRDQAILRAVFLDELSKDEVCKGSASAEITCAFCSTGRRRNFELRWASNPCVLKWIPLGGEEFSPE